MRVDENGNVTVAGVLCGNISSPNIRDMVAAMQRPDVKPAVRKRSVPDTPMREFHVVLYRDHSVCPRCGKAEFHWRLEEPAGSGEATYTLRVGYCLQCRADLYMKLGHVFTQVGHVSGYVRTGGKLQNEVLQSSTQGVEDRTI